MTSERNPIATAPRDGTRILGFVDGSPHPVRWDDGYSVHGLGGRWMTDDGFTYFGAEVTEWAPAEEEAFDPNDEKNYPPKGTPLGCLIVAIDSENFRILGHTGRFFHGQINCAGFQGEEVGLVDVPDAPGFWVLENASAFADEETVECGGDWRAAMPADFDHYEVDLPECLKLLVQVRE